MLLDDLVGVIETLKERIATHGASLRASETRTRMALIDPLLQALGWDTSDPAVVTPEYDVSGRKADYALLGTSVIPSATVEAKKLGEPLSPHRMQMLNYSNASGVEYAGLTDGDLWELYEVFKRGQLEERRILDVSIANTPTHEAALKLLLLWRSNLTSGQPVAANPLVVVTFTEMPSEPTPTAPIPTPALVSPAPVMAPGDWTPLSQVSEVKGQKPPTAIKFNNSDPRAVRAWWQVLAEVANCLAEYGHLTVADCPIDTGRGWQFINSVPRSPNGREFATPKRIPSGIYLETKMSSDLIIRHSKRLLARFGFSAEITELRFG